MYYSPDIPAVIQSEKHTYLDVSLCELFTSQMVFAWVSGGNTANIYNTCMANLEHQEILHPTPWTESTRRLTTEQIWDAFFLNALLRDANERGENLTLVDGGTHDERLKKAMVARNARMLLYGQPMRMHACKKCEIKDPTTGSKCSHLELCIITDFLLPFRASPSRCY